MKILDVIQGEEDWHQARKDYPHTASLASIMMGCSPNVERSELVAITAIGSEQEFSDFVLNRVFPKGHAVEAMARPIAEGIIGEDLFPITALCEDGQLLASFDGATVAADIIWECKQWNEIKAADVQESTLPDCDKWQVCQQLVVSRAEKNLYMVSDGSEEKTVWMWYHLSSDDEAKLRAGWAQFDEDVANYKHVEVKPEVEGKAPDSLPALNIEVTGMVTASNLAAFKAHAQVVLGGINTELESDKDFADAEKTVKWCKEVEQRLAAAKDHALSQTASIDELFRTITDISESTRAKRLELSKLVSAKKKFLKDKLLFDAKKGVEAWAKTEFKVLFNGKGIPLNMPVVDFAMAIRGKKLLSSMQSALDDMTAAFQVEFSLTTEKISENLALLNKVADDHRMLFPDLEALYKPQPDFASLVDYRVTKHKQAEAVRLDELKKTIRAEEEAKVRRVAEEKAKQAAEPVQKAEQSEPEPVQKAELAEQTVWLDESKEISEEAIEKLNPKLFNDGLAALTPAPEPELVCPCCLATLKLSYGGLVEA